MVKAAQSGITWVKVSIFFCAIVRYAMNWDCEGETEVILLLKAK